MSTLVQPTPLAASPTSKRLRIAELYSPLTTVGGGERQMLEEVRSLLLLGHDVAAFTFELGSGGAFVAGVDMDAITLIASGGSPVAKSKGLRQVLRDGGFELVVAHTSPEIAWLATRGLDVPFVVYHNDPPFTPYGNLFMGSRRYRSALRQVGETVAGYRDVELPRSRLRAEVRTALKHRALVKAAAVVVPSDRTRNELRLLHGVDAVVVRGCLPSSPAPLSQPIEGLAPPGAPVVLSVCRLHRVKRVDLLLRSFALTRRAVPEAALIVVGTGPEEGHLHRLARALGLDSAVHFAGAVSDHELPRYHARADVFAAPAMADYAIAPYEALARGCRLVVTDEMELTEDLLQSPRIVVSPPRDRDFATAIVTALRRPIGPAPNLSGMTWDARGAAVGRLYSRLVSDVADGRA